MIFTPLIKTINWIYSDAASTASAVFITAAS